jgi:tetratricopeptide (TPR) repeat protein
VREHALAFAVLAAGLFSGCSSAPPVEELRSHANESFAREEYKRTVAFDNEILRLNPEDYNATVQRGVAYDRIGSVADAQADFSRAIELQPEAPLPRLYRANLALKLNRADMATSDIQALQGLELENHEQVATLCLAGTAAQKRGDWAGALKNYQTAIDAGKNDPDPTTQKHVRDALNNASECQYRLGRFDHAEKLYGDVVKAKYQAEEPITEGDHYTLGVLNYLKGDFSKAKQHFAKVSPAKKKQAAKLLNDEGFFQGK